MNDNKFAMVAKTFQGLEEVLRDELLALGAQNVEVGLRMVQFEGDLAMMYRANFCLRTALRILKPIVKFTAADTDELYDCVRDIEWEKYLSADSTFAIDSTVNSDEFPHSKFVTYRVKDGIVDHFSDKYGKRPSIRLNGADLQLNVHISGTRVTISLDSSGAPLNQRGWRVDTTEAPINEVLAAGIILKTGWRGDSDFVDPMCGSGTFLVEAALIAANIYPGIFRKEYAFERWNNFDAELLAEISADDSEERDFNHKIYGGDIDPEAVAVARRNIHAAHLDSMVELRCAPFDEWTTPPPAAILVTNPPYGERLKPENLEELYKTIGRTLKSHFAGYHAWILGYKEDHFKHIGLKPSIKFPLLNGSLECQLVEYVLFDGDYSSFRRDGGSIGNLNRDRDMRPKVRHLSDDEWEEETSRFERPDRRKTDRRREFRRDGGRAPRREGRKDFRRRDDDRSEKRKDFRHRDDERFEKRKDFRRRDDDRFEKRKDFRRRDDERRVRDSEYRARPAAEVQFKGPRLPEESRTDLAGGRVMRSRRGWYKSQQNDDNNTED